MSLQVLLGSTIENPTPAVRKRGWTSDGFRLRKYHEQSEVPEFYRSLPALLNEGRRLNLPKPVVDTALYFVRKQHEKPKKDKAWVNPVALYLACRMHGIQRDPEEFLATIPKTSRTKPFKIVKLAHELADRLGLDMKPENVDLTIFDAVQNLGLPRFLYESVLDLITKLNREFPSSSSRKTNAGALIWLLSREAKYSCAPNQKQVADSLGIGEYTIRERATEIRKMIGWTKPKTAKTVLGSCE